MDSVDNPPAGPAARDGEALVIPQAVHNWDVLGTEGKTAGAGGASDAEPVHLLNAYCLRRRGKARTRLGAGAVFQRKAGRMSGALLRR